MIINKRIFHKKNEILLLFLRYYEKQRYLFTNSHSHLIRILDIKSHYIICKILTKLNAEWLNFTLKEINKSLESDN